VAYADAAPQDEMKLSDTELLSILAAEKQASIGFENSTELDRKRQQSLEYSKGEMKDVPSLPNRSKAVSTDVADAIETVLPDLMEIFTGGEDVASFDPQGEEDEEGAKQETEYVNYVAFRKLGGWKLLYTAIKDALQVDTGIIDTWWADEEKTDEKQFQGITAPQLSMLMENGFVILEKEPVPAGPDGLETYNVKAEQTYDAGCIKSAAVDPSNLSVAPDTVDIADGTYCVVRSFPRAQSLVDQGFEKELVDQLPDYPNRGDEQTERSRDLSGEQDTSNSGAANKHLRTVQVLKHWVRVDGDQDGKTELWCVHTDDQCKVILDKRKVNRVGLAVGTPFIQTHRFYGMSLAEKLVEIQKIKTALVRMMLDSGYFAMNQRLYVAEDKANDNTVPDILRNEPGVPIRGRIEGAVSPIQAGQLGFDVQMALEYVSTMAEQRSGVVRNAQGLNPDTLHDTAKGAMALMSMAQRRVRMIARVLAETLVKGWFLNIHALSRTHNTRQEKVRLRGKWVDIDPSTFGERADMLIEVGVGSGGKETELVMMDKMFEYIERIVDRQGGLNGPLVMADNVYNLLKRMTERAGFKAPEQFWTDPEEAPPQQPQPDPEMIKVQAEAQAAQVKAQTEMAKLQAENEWVNIEAQKTAFEARASEQEARIRAAETGAREQNDRLKIELEAQKAQAEIEIKRQELELKKAELGIKQQELGARVQMEADKRTHDKEMRRFDASASMTETAMQHEHEAGQAEAGAEPETEQEAKPDRDEMMLELIRGISEQNAAILRSQSGRRRVVRDETGRVSHVEIEGND